MNQDDHIAVTTLIVIAAVFLTIFVVNVIKAGGVK